MITMDLKANHKNTPGALNTIKSKCVWAKGKGRLEMHFGLFATALVTANKDKAWITGTGNKKTIALTNETAENIPPAYFTPMLRRFFAPA